MEMDLVSRDGIRYSLVRIDDSAKTNMSIFRKSSLLSCEFKLAWCHYSGFLKTPRPGARG